MAKILFLVIGLVVAYFVLKAYRRRVRRREDHPPQGAEDMVRCAQCGVHLPRSESVTVDQTSYCSTEHRRLHHGTD